MTEVWTDSFKAEDKIRNLAGVEKVVSHCLFLSYIHYSVAQKRMSAYGAVVARNRPTAPLASTVWSCKSRGPASPKYLSLHHLTLSTANELPGLLPYLHRCFAEEIERGTTYPQEILQGETYSMEAFESYYFAADVIVGIIGEGEMPGADGGSVPLSIEAERNGRSWEECVAGTYYVKPNYPGRSSHVCSDPRCCCLD